jgi:hypothetical protein
MRIGLSERVAHSVSVGNRVIFTNDVEEVLYGFREFLFLPYQLIKENNNLKRNCWCEFSVLQLLPQNLN